MLKELYSSIFHKHTEGWATPQSQQGLFKGNDLREGSYLCKHLLPLPAPAWCFPSLPSRDASSPGCTELHLAGASLTVINAHNGKQEETARQGTNAHILWPGPASSSCSQTQQCTHPTPLPCPRPSPGSFQELSGLIAPNPTTKGILFMEWLSSGRRRQHNGEEQLLCISGSSCGL